MLSLLRLFCDVLIIGSGAASLSTVLGLSKTVHIIILAKKNTLIEGNTFYTQVGIAAVLDDTDSINWHIIDTVAAGAGLCNSRVIRFVTESTPGAILAFNRI